jgi:hypothetical protein
MLAFTPILVIWAGLLRTSMTREKIYVVQAFTAGKGKSLRADVPIPCRSAETARRTAERLAPAKGGVVAFSMAGDAELGDYDDEPTIIFKAGQLPAQFEGTCAALPLPP